MLEARHVSVPGPTKVSRSALRRWAVCCVAARALLGQVRTGPAHGRAAGDGLSQLRRFAKCFDDAHVREALPARRLWLHPVPYAVHEVADLRSDLVALMERLTGRFFLRLDGEVDVVHVLVSAIDRQRARGA